jgi:hypothetical protein
MPYPTGTGHDSYLCAHVSALQAVDFVVRFLSVAQAVEMPASDRCWP